MLVPAVHFIPGGYPRAERNEVAGARGGVQVHERRRVVRHRARDSAAPGDETEFYTGIQMRERRNSCFSASRVMNLKFERPTIRIDGRIQLKPRFEPSGHGVRDR